MWDLLRPTTLAAIVTDLQEVLEEGTEDYSAFTALDSAKIALVHAVGYDMAQEMVGHVFTAGNVLYAAANATLNLWNKYGLGDDDAESEPVWSALCRALEQYHKEAMNNG